MGYLYGEEKLKGEKIECNIDATPQQRYLEMAKWDLDNIQQSVDMLAKLGIIVKCEVTNDKTFIENLPEVIITFK